MLGGGDKKDDFDRAGQKTTASENIVIRAKTGEKREKKNFLGVTSSTYLMLLSSHVRRARKRK